MLYAVKLSFESTVFVEAPDEEAARRGMGDVIFSDENDAFAPGVDAVEPLVELPPHEDVEHEFDAAGNQV